MSNVSLRGFQTQTLILKNHKLSEVLHFNISQRQFRCLTSNWPSQMSNSLPFCVSWLPSWICVLVYKLIWEKNCDRIKKLALKKGLGQTQVWMRSKYLSFINFLGSAVKKYFLRICRIPFSGQWRKSFWRYTLRRIISDKSVKCESQPKNKEYVIQKYLREYLAHKAPFVKNRYDSKIKEKKSLKKKRAKQAFWT